MVEILKEIIKIKSNITIHEVEFRTTQGEVYILGLPTDKYLEERTFLSHMISNALPNNNGYLGEDDIPIVLDRIAEYFMVKPLYFKRDKNHERVRIGSSIRTIREKKNIEAKELAMKADMDAANLSRIEKGKFSTGIDTLGKIASALDSKIEIIPNSATIVKGLGKKREVHNLTLRILSEDISQIAHNTELFCGAGIIISDKEVPNSMGGWYEKILVVTPYAKELSWLIERIRDIYGNLINLDNKEPFYGSLADAANRYIKTGDGSMKGLLIYVIGEAVMFNL